MTLAEVKTELRDAETARLGAIWSRTHRNWGELRRWRRWNLWANMVVVELWHVMTHEEGMLNYALAVGCGS
ncbi:hypothetical protein PS2_041978 [Malus domestica]